MKPKDFRDFSWISPWQPISAAGCEAYAAELRSELAADHPLFAVPFTAVGRVFQDDDVLFILDGHPSPLAVVHLTFTGSPEKDGRWPTAQFYPSLEEWVEKRMIPDAARYERVRRSKAA